ncbi:MAG: hypothetical protein JSS79_16850 [Bacteroidetes bacterium]|nr:hypothetical protein [Bacteroidota bacterium]
MKSFLFALILCVGVTNSLQACPFCGCGNSNFQIGLLPTYSKGFVGTRYTYSQFNSSSADGSQFSRDYFHSMEIWGGYQVGKVQIMAFIPFIRTHKISDDGVVNTSGIGDIILLGNYKLFTHTSAVRPSGRVWSNNLMIGGGIKLHTGESKIDTSDPAFTVGDFSSMPGTGSTDYLINATHNLLTGNDGLVTNATYRINTTNMQDYKFGNRVYINMAYFHSWSAGFFTIRPSVGVNLISNSANSYQRQEVSGSAGYVLSGLAGVNIQRGKIGLAANGFLPVAQNLFEGQTRFQVRGSVALLVSF